MGNIVVLDENTANKIAAGEVIERPASAVKELIENSIDAGASAITVEIKNGGISYIKIADNGSGIETDDAVLAFDRHATSKIRNSNDLESISTMGFRGEALASISAVSAVELITRTAKNSYGTYVKIQGGVVKETGQKGCSQGTVFVIKDLFYNTPARFKFLKKDTTEAGYVSDIVSRIALGNPHISFRLISNGSTILHTPGNNDLLSAIFSIYGRETANQLLKVDYKDKGVGISGYVGKPEIARANRNHQSIYLNNRYIKSKIITAALDEAFKTYLIKNKFPFAVLSIEVNSLFVDVNVHPTKIEVRFSDEQGIFRSVYHAVNNALLSEFTVKDVALDSKKNVFKFDDIDHPEAKYVQQSLNMPESVVREVKVSAHMSEEKLEGVPEQEAVHEQSVPKPYKTEGTYGRLTTDEEQINESFELLKNTEQNKYSEQSDCTQQNSYSIQNDNERQNANVIQNANAVINDRSAKQNEHIKHDGDIKQYDNLTQNEHAITNDASANCNVSETNDSALHDSTHTNNVAVLLENTKIIGQAFSTYIMLQDRDSLIVLDQHAAHERIMYERFKAKFHANEAMAQFLVTPVSLELTHSELKLLEEKKEFFNKIGFIYEDFGNNSIILRSTPGYADSVPVREAFLEVLDKVSESWKTDYKSTEDEVIYSIACKAAIKANRKMGEPEIRGLLRDLIKLENPYTCPHGRPVIVKIGKNEFEKMFKRIV